MAVKIKDTISSENNSSDKYFSQLVDAVRDDLSDVASRSGYNDTAMGVNLNMNGYSITNTTTDISPTATATSTSFDDTDTITSDNVHSALVEVDDAIIAHTDDTDNPHEVTASDVGLGNVDNTADADKPISDATQDAIDDKLVLDDADIDTTATVDGSLVLTGGNLLSGEGMHVIYHSYSSTVTLYAAPSLTIGDNGTVLKRMTYLSATLYKTNTFAAHSVHSLTANTSSLNLIRSSDVTTVCSINTRSTTEALPILIGCKYRTDTQYLYVFYINPTDDTITLDYNFNLVVEFIQF